MDRAFGYEPRGRGFESLRARIFYYFFTLDSHPRKEFGFANSGGSTSHKTIHRIVLFGRVSGAYFLLFLHFYCRDSNFIFYTAHRNFVYWHSQLVCNIFMGSLRVVYKNWWACVPTLLIVLNFTNCNRIRHIRNNIRGMQLLRYNKGYYFCNQDSSQTVVYQFPF